MVAGRTVLDLGAGSGLVAVAAAQAGARSVVASDPDPYSATAVAVNAETNGVGPFAVVGDLLDEEPPDVDVVLAGDVCYDRAMTERVLPFLGQAWLRGATVLLGDPGRRLRPARGTAGRGRLRRPGQRRAGPPDDGVAAALTARPEGDDRHVRNIAPRIVTAR